tara:strand:+ start:330 stop:773 length:444 start_codon:yes stop_codon:yes gene_type:complete
MQIKTIKSQRGVGDEPTPRVWLNGCFDVLHYGHIHLFQQAKLLFPNCNLRVGVDSDKRIRQMKGEKRPINDLFHRVAFLNAIGWVDEVVTFSTDDELREQIREYSADIMCIGEEYRNRTIIGEELIPRIHYVEKYGGFSTTSIVNGG